jgi:benzoyl-CoA-dihydrodiol lyase
MQSNVTPVPAPLLYEREAGSWRHWKLSIDGRIATVAMDVDPEAACATATSSS